MGWHKHHLKLCLPLAKGLAWTVLMAAVLSAVIVRAANDDDDDDDNAPVAQQPGGQVFVLSPENFDQWVFNGVGNSTQGMKQIDSQLDLQLETIDRVCKLSDAQKQKLQLAGDADVKKFRNQYDALKQKYQNTKQNPNDLNKVFQAIAPLRTQWQAGLFEENSVFHKVLKNTLTPEQWTAYEDEQAVRNKFIFKAKIKLAVEALQGSMALTDDQRQKFEKLLLEETKPPLKYTQQQYDFYAVMIQASRLPESKLKTIFDDAQLRSLKQVFAQAKGMEQMLRQEGVLPDDHPKASPIPHTGMITPDLS